MIVFKNTVFFLSHATMCHHWEHCSICFWFSFWNGRKLPVTIFWCVRKWSQRVEMGCGVWKWTRRVVMDSKKEFSSISDAFFEGNRPISDPKWQKRGCFLYRRRIFRPRTQIFWPRTRRSRVRGQKIFVRGRKILPRYEKKASLNHSLCNLFFWFERSENKLGQWCLGIRAEGSEKFGPKAQQSRQAKRIFKESLGRRPKKAAGQVSTFFRRLIFFFQFWFCFVENCSSVSTRMESKFNFFGDFYLAVQREQGIFKSRRKSQMWVKKIIFECLISIHFTPVHLLALFHHIYLISFPCISFYWIHFAHFVSPFCLLSLSASPSSTFCTFLWLSLSPALPHFWLWMVHLFRPLCLSSWIKIPINYCISLVVWTKFSLKKFFHFTRNPTRVTPRNWWNMTKWNRNLHDCEAWMHVSFFVHVYCTSKHLNFSPPWHPQYVGTWHEN